MTVTLTSSRTRWTLRVLLLTAMFLSCLLLYTPTSTQAAPLPKGKPPVTEVFDRYIRVDVATAKGKLMENWAKFIKEQYPGWKVVDGPYAAMGRRFVIIAISVIKTVPVTGLVPMVVPMDCTYNGKTVHPPICPDEVD